MDIHKQNYNSKVLVEMWTDFIHWEKRRLGENDFLINNLNKRKKIFDACLGDGADSIYLLKKGFDVTSNDIDNLFIEKARENAKKHDVNLNITEFDWRVLDKYFDSFDAVFCLGNSLSYLFEKKDQLKALKNFFNMLGDDGILIIDERNYQSILDKREEIINNGNFQYSGKFVYCGDNVHGEPIEISDSEVRFEYTDKRTGKKGHLVLYPFKKGELMGLLREAGFTRIEQYSDYEKGYDHEADFVQYVCGK